MSHKKIHRFLVQAIPAATIGDSITVTDPVATKQIHRVLKLVPGEQVQCFVDRGAEYTITINETTNTSLIGTVIAINATPFPPREVVAAVSIVKGDTFELIVQKLTELGVSTIVPLVTSRTIKKSVRTDRLQTISDEAVEQSGGTMRVHIAEPMTLKECFAAYPYESIVLDPVANNTATNTLPEKLVFYVGPEGGWDEQDEAILKSFNPQQLQITDRVLRTETAAIVGAYKLLWE